MLEDYKKAVIFNYHKKKEMGKLSLNLAHPTAAKLRQECLIALKARTKKEDRDIIRDFFNYGVESNDYGPSIKKFDRDKLKPLDNFIKEGNDPRDEKNVEVLAWLINFEPRPYEYGVDYTKYISHDEEEVIVDEPLVEPPSEQEPPDGELRSKPAPKGPFTVRKGIASVVVLFLVIGGIYLYADQNKAYVCDHGSAKKYHPNPDCPFLKNCKNGVVQTTIAEAEKNGKTRCRFEP